MLRKRISKLSFCFIFVFACKTTGNRSSNLHTFAAIQAVTANPDGTLTITCNDGFVTVKTREDYEAGRICDHPKCQDAGRSYPEGAKLKCERRNSRIESVGDPGQSCESVKEACKKTLMEGPLAGKSDESCSAIEAKKDCEEPKGDDSRLVFANLPNKNTVRTALCEQLCVKPTVCLDLKVDSVTCRDGRWVP